MSEWWTYRLSDFLLFSPATWWRMVDAYQSAWWPLRLVWVLIGVVAMVRFGRLPARPSLLVTAAAWLWIACAFHWQRYAAINWVAPWLAAASVGEGALLAVVALRAPGPGAARARPRVGRWLLVAAVAGLPLFDLAVGRGWRTAGVAGMMPDPTAVATLGIVLASGRRPGLLLPIPILMALLGGATLLAMDEPGAWVAPLAAAAALAALTWPGRRPAGRAAA